MNIEQLDQWNQAVDEHMSMLESLINDRIALKSMFNEHLRKFFDYDSIEYSKDFKVITLRWDYGRNVSIDNDTISNLGMGWVISTEFTDKLGYGVVVTVYPFGSDKESDI